MPSVGQTGRLLLAVGAGLFGVALLAGIIESMRVDRRLPAIDMIGNGSEAFIEHLVDRKDYDAAIKELEMQTRIPPPNAAAHERLGKLLLRTDRPQEAAHHFNEAIKLDPYFPTAYNGLGLALVQLGELAPAEKCFTKAVELLPNDINAQSNLDQARKELRDRMKKGEPGESP